MSDSVHMSNRRGSMKSKITCSNKNSMSYLVSSASKGLSQKTSKCIHSLKQGIQGNAGDIILFLATTAALEIVRRFSKAKCPFIWRALQALQILCYPPFKWLERWSPFKGLVKHSQKLSRPMLVLSIATVFTDLPDTPKEASADLPDTPTEASTNLNEIQESSSSSSSGSDPNSRPRDEVPETSPTEDWLINLHSELKRQGITIPERLNDDEFRQFYTVAKGDFTKLLSSVKKTISWRQSYKLLSQQELEPWSHLVYWHGHDVMQRPCLIIRLGLACCNTGSTDRPLFVKAVVSQIEHGVVNLVSREQPQMMVLMDCEGLSPFGFPIHTMKSCAILLQDHYPNRLSCLLIIRLPQIARVITQALFQVLKPATQRKVRIIGGDYRKVLSECLDSVPVFLGGNCSCESCSVLGQMQNRDTEITTTMPTLEGLTGRDLPETTDHLLRANNGSDGREVSSKTIVVALVAIWLIVFFMMGMHKEKLFAVYEHICKLLSVDA